MITHTHEEIEQAKEFGIEKGYANAKEQWKEEAFACLKETCVDMETFTMNDVRDKMKLTTHDNRAWGGVVKRGVKAGLIIATGRSIPSKVGHGVHLQIWRSRIYGKKVSYL